MKSFLPVHLMGFRKMGCLGPDSEHKAYRSYHPEESDVLCVSHGVWCSWKPYIEVPGASIQRLLQPVAGMWAHLPGSRCQCPTHVPLCALSGWSCPRHSPEAKRTLRGHPAPHLSLETPSFLVSGGALLRRTNKPFLEIFEFSWEDPVLAQSPS